MENIEENEIKYRYKTKIEPRIRLNFNGYKFDEYVLHNYYKIQNKYGEFIEFLPGIYYKEVRNFNMGFVDKHIKKYNGASGKIYRRIFCWILDKVFVNNQRVEIAFKFENFRDDIIIDFNNNEVYSNQSPKEDCRQQLIFSNKHKYECEYSVEYKEVETSKIMYPFQCGGDGSRCRIKGMFQQLDLLGGFQQYEYVFFEEHEMFLASSNIDNLMEECKKFKNCVSLYKRFSDNSYVHPSTENWGDNIRLEEYDGVFKISNANNRVCCAKRFKIPTIYAEVYKYTAKEENKEKHTSDLHRLRNSRMDNGINRKILENFYSKLEKLGIKAENGHYILKEGLRGKRLIQYIEETTGKTLYELYKFKINSVYS